MLTLCYGQFFKMAVKETDVQWNSIRNDGLNRDELIQMMPEMHLFAFVCSMYERLHYDVEHAL